MLEQRARVMVRVDEERNLARIDVRAGDGLTQAVVLLRPDETMSLADDLTIVGEQLNAAGSRSAQEQGALDARTTDARKQKEQR